MSVKLRRWCDFWDEADPNLLSLFPSAGSRRWLIQKYGEQLKNARVLFRHHNRYFVDADKLPSALEEIITEDAE
jgi:hypothetical protein